jgi:hypothetical protein
MGEIDFCDTQNICYDIKCCSDITLKHIIHQTVCNIFNYNLDDDNIQNKDVQLNFLNLMTGKITKITLNLTKNKIHNIIKILLENKKQKCN